LIAVVLRMLVDGKGRKFFVEGESGSTKVGGLGVVSLDRLAKFSDGDEVDIAGKKFRLLPPTIEDMLSSIHRGPQIIMPKDAAQIVHHLSIGCGSTVVEGGSGSGSLTLSLLKAVYPAGRVISFDNRREYLHIASRNVRASGMSSSWYPVLGDIRSASLGGRADAMAVDIPDPWNVLSAASSMLKAGGMLAVYVPTINQTERTVVSSAGKAFIHEVSFESIFRRLEISEGASRHSFDTLGHSGYISIFRKVSEGTG
jgi:tRNA (adenine57-N1/adenine58-N1)-methyltransferase